MEEDNKQNDEIKEYADGWITERKGTDVPVFLKYAFLVIAGGCIAYLLIYMNGEVNSSEHGSLVQGFNSVTKTADGFMYFVLALILIYVVILALFAFRKSHHD